MSYKFDEAAQQRMGEYVEGIGDILANKRRRASFACYFLGLLGDSERKSVEPIAARAAASEEETRAMTERLLHFVGDSKWDDGRVRRFATRHALRAMTADESVDSWIIDDTGMLKQGRESPGVQRQYTGSAGKTANCQIATSLTLCTRTSELAVDMDLYMPAEWIDDDDRRQRARIPAELVFRPKWKIALDLIERAVEAQYPQGVVLADSAYGDVGAFRRRIRELGLDYALDVKVHTRVRIVGSDGSVSHTMRVDEVAEVIGAGAFRKVTWRAGTRRKLVSRFAAIRVRPVSEDQADGAEEQWLVVERPKRNEPAEHYVLTTLPSRYTRKQLVRRIKQRWRIERTYEDMKGELGLDHFEGRSYPGWQHHVSCVLACAAFVVAERTRHFPPSQGGAQADHTLARAA
jgi:SRSO17 transposase